MILYVGIYWQKTEVFMKSIRTTKLRRPPFPLFFAKHNNFFDGVVPLPRLERGRPKDNRF